MSNDPNEEGAFTRCTVLTLVEVSSWTRFEINFWTLAAEIMCRGALEVLCWQNGVNEADEAQKSLIDTILASVCFG